MITINKGLPTQRKFTNQYEADKYWDWLSHRYSDQEHTIEDSEGFSARGTSFCLYGCIYCGRHPEELNVAVPSEFED